MLSYFYETRDLGGRFHPIPGNFRARKSMNSSGSILRSLRFLLLVPLFLSCSDRLAATPPDVVETRESLLGADDSIMALWVQTRENEGSHYFRRETLTLSLRRIADGTEIERKVISVVEYLPDVNGEDSARVVVESHDLDVASLLRRLPLELPFHSGWMTSFVMQGASLGYDDRGMRTVPVLDSTTIRRYFDAEEEEAGESEYILHSVLRVRSGRWLFVEIRRDDGVAIEPTTRIVPVDYEWLHGTVYTTGK